MKIVRYEYGGAISYGVLRGDRIYPVTGDIFGVYSIAEEAVPLEGAELLVPCEPTKIVAVGLNYSEHAAEMKENCQREAPVLFFKPVTALLAPGKTIIRPKQSKRVDYEAELAVVIGKKAKDVPLSEANQYIFGYTCLNDVTARDLQKQDGQWTRAKGFDTFAPMGPVIETELDPSALTVSLQLNGTVKQLDNTKNMLFSPAELVSFVSGIMTLLPGDVISTGTPAGIGPMESGDVVSLTIDGIGTLVNSVK
ncbi:MAG: fumarylacetoacetate hydrolase family protein [Clostridia bacterium]|nr:fumarylacetoacetate hydrolase family protein [Clostridia bacterium]